MPNNLRIIGVCLGLAIIPPFVMLTYYLPSGEAETQNGTEITAKNRKGTLYVYSADR